MPVHMHVYMYVLRDIVECAAGGCLVFGLPLEFAASVRRLAHLPRHLCATVGWCGGSLLEYTLSCHVAVETSSGVGAIRCREASSRGL